MTVDEQRFDPEILDLIPHRPPMLLINQIVDVSDQASSSVVHIDKETPFYQPELGVPSWIGLEYMGQTAALIAGHQLRVGLVKPHLGLLLGSRSYSVELEYFVGNSQLLVSCKQAAVVGESLVTFNCTISDNLVQRTLAQAKLSVFRQPLDKTI